MKLIQGFFVQPHTGLDLDYSVALEGSVGAARRFIVPFMYAGVIWMQEGTAEWQGEMLDQYGYARLSDITIEDELIGFTKQYLRGDGVFVPKDGIFYSFYSREGNTWVGQYTHPVISPGPTRCIITDVDDELFHKDIRAFLETNAVQFRTEQDELARLGATVDGSDPSEFEERGRLIEGMLDKIYSFDPGMPDNVREGVERDRQMLVLRSGWNSMPIEQLREVAAAS